MANFRCFIVSDKNHLSHLKIDGSENVENVGNSGKNVNNYRKSDSGKKLKVGKKWKSERK